MGSGNPYAGSGGGGSTRTLGGGGGGSNPYGGGGGGKGGGGAAAAVQLSAAGARPKAQNPSAEDQLTAQLSRFARAYSLVGKNDQKKILDTISQYGSGLSKDQLTKVASSLPPGTKFSFDKKGYDPGAIKYLTNPTGHVASIGASTLGTTLDLLSRPQQGLMSTIGQAWRTQGFQDPEALGKAFVEGVAGKRHDTPSSIIAENTGYKLKGVGKVATDFAGSVATDPFTYLTFGLSAEAKAALRGISETLGAEKAGVAASKGLKALDAADRAVLADKLAPDVLKAAERGIRGGIKVSLPELASRKVPFTGGGLSRPAIRLGEGRTIVPGVFAQAKAGKIIAASGNTLTEAAAREAQLARQAAEAARSEADKLHAQAGLADLASGGNVSGRLEAIKQEGTTLVNRANELDAQAAHLERAGQDGTQLRDQARAAELKAQDLANEMQQLQGRAESANRAAEMNARAAKLDDTATAAEQKVETLIRERQASATSVAEKLASSPVAKMIDKLGDTRLATQLRGMFIPRGNLARVAGPGAAEQWDTIRAAGIGGRNAPIEEASVRISHALKEAKPTQEELTQIGHVIDTGGNAAQLPERLRPLHEAIQGVLYDAERSQLDEGVLAAEHLHEGGYLPHYETPEAAAIRTKNDVATRGSSPSPSMTRQSGSLRERKLQDTVENLNRDFAVENPGVNQFETNPAAIALRRRAEAASDVANHRTANDVLTLRDRAGERIAFSEAEVNAGKVKVPSNYEAVPVRSAVIDPKTGEHQVISHIFMPKELRSEFESAQRLMIGDEAMKGFLRFYDGWMRWSKDWMTVPLPFGLGFHERNAMGNITNNWLKGIRDLAPYEEAARIQMALTKGRKEGDLYRYLTPRQKEIVDNARKRDILGEGQYGRDIGRPETTQTRTPFRALSAKDQAKRVGKAANPFSHDFFLVKGGRRVGTTVEDNARLAHFIYMGEKYKNWDEAARSVRATLIDYSDLTATEREVFKRVIPFYTFMRKNLPIQIGAMLRTPGKFSHIQEARKAVAGSADEPQGLYPNYLPDVGGTPAPMGLSAALSKVPFFGGDPNQQLVLAPDLPMNNAAQTLTPAIQLFASLPGVDRVAGRFQNPNGAAGAFGDLVDQNVSGGMFGAGKTVVQAALGKSLFTGQSLSGRTSAPFYAKAVPGVADNRVLPGQTKPEPTITKLSKFVAEDTFPGLSKFAGFFPQGSKEQEKAPRRRISALTGLRVYPLGPGASTGEALRRIELINKMIADLKASGVTPPTKKRSKKFVP